MGWVPVQLINPILHKVVGSLVIGLLPDLLGFFPELYDELVHYYKHASTAYATIKLPKVNGAKLVTTVSDTSKHYAAANI
jgi:hypothetical protein